MSITHESFLVTGKKLAARLYIPDSNATYPAVVVYPGYRGKRKRYGVLARDLMGHGIAVLIFDYRGVGSSEGDIAEQAIADSFTDALAAYDFLAAAKRIDPTRIGILGVSYGAYVGAIVAGQRSVQSLLLGSPAMYDDAWWNQSVASINTDSLREFRRSANFAETKPLKSLAAFAGHLFVVWHELDEQMPERIARAYYDVGIHATERSSYAISGLGHAMTAEKAEEFSNIVCKWFADTLQGE